MSKILVCAATTTEAGACEAGIRKAGASERFEILHTGIGPAAAAHVLKERLGSGPKPALIVSSGFAGSWSTGLDVGTWICAQTVFNELGVPIGGLKSIPETTATLLFSVPEILEFPPNDLIGGANTSNLPLAVDMESFVLAQVARSSGIEVAILRYISDSPRNPLPAFIRHFTNVAIQDELAGRASALLKGSRALITSPGKLASFLKIGVRWRSELVSGWERFSSIIL